MLAETLTSGARRLRADEASFVVSRVRPGVVLVVAAGSDRGQFGDRVVAELSAELERFSGELELFVDARRVDRVAMDARAVWTAWLERNRDRVPRIHMLTATPHVQLLAEVAGHYSRTKLVAHDDPAAFEAALDRARGSWRLPREDAPSATVRRERTRSTVAIDDGACRQVLRWSENTLLLVISGEDRGTLASDVFDEIRSGRRGGTRLDLFIDLRDAAMPTPEVSDLWSAWFAANRTTLASVTILSTTKAVSLTADIAGWRSRTGGLVRVVSDPVAFADTLRRAAPALSP